MEIIYVNCGWRNEYGSDPHIYEHYSRSSEIVMGTNPLQTWIFSGVIFTAT